MYLRMTPATKDVLYQLYIATDDIWGLQLSRLSKRPTGTVYPLLDRLERGGYVSSHWDVSESRPGPRRRLYSLTTIGRKWVEQKLKLGIQPIPKEE